MEDSGDHPVHKKAFESPFVHAKHFKEAYAPDFEMQEASSSVVNKIFTPLPPRRVKKKQVSGQSSTKSFQNSSSSRGGESW
eukprot:5384130-Pleurochrysis_carterae.AAC.1